VSSLLDDLDARIVNFNNVAQRCSQGVLERFESMNFDWSADTLLQDHNSLPMLINVL